MVGKLKTQVQSLGDGEIDGHCFNVFHLAVLLFLSFILI